MRLAPFLRVRQNFPSHRIENLPEEVHRQMDAAEFHRGLKPGAKVAIGAGSRGIENLATIVGASAAWWKGRGFRPFVFPAMGSHGSATPTGQAAVLAQYGITAAAMGCPVLSSLDVVELGETPEGIRTYIDQRAWNAGAVMLVARVKEHTDFEGGIESGLFKMMAIGMGKLAGAKYYHMHAYHLGMERVVRTVGRKILASGKILGGLAILEDANHATGKVEAVRAESMEQREEELLALAKSWRGRLPVERVDILMLNEIGKNISGTGMDAKIVNRDNRGGVNCWPGLPWVGRIYVRGLSAQTCGNAVGIGMADMVHARAVRKMNRRASYVNAVTASSCQVVKIPMYFPTDRECLEALSTMVGKIRAEDVTLVWMKNSLDLTDIYVSANLRKELEANPQVSILAGSRELELGPDGNLVDWLGE